MNQEAWFLRLSLDDSCTSELKRKEENNIPVGEEGPVIGGQGVLAVDTEAGRAEVGPKLGAPSCVHFIYKLSCELYLGPG